MVIIYHNLGTTAAAAAAAAVWPRSSEDVRRKGEEVGKRREVCVCDLFCTIVQIKFFGSRATWSLSTSTSTSLHSSMLFSSEDTRGEGGEDSHEEGRTDGSFWTGRDNWEFCTTVQYVLTVRNLFLSVSVVYTERKSLVLVVLIIPVIDQKHTEGVTSRHDSAGCRSV
ncbi:uncharacterized protein BO97DRAFT_67073 [Aspergillus homomorphus CBS 101889]|uniref:Uncharacterized protein n=1 Tax=Aspergillus homomorphus (strain CBS 101889) TaxID=1450537 RepID=A0A395I0A0_ASPHC|nr:hypothetical protein BO97DRAFT_67073 [Aspergillus homomorphus CBS 101889]RAL11954.1 hypothetical protein BO97DRAFT_67073 [Aspergillus homomorphus CBS 101889]